jgi:hypothetical protein
MAPEHGDYGAGSEAVRIFPSAPQDACRNHARLHLRTSDGRRPTSGPQRPSSSQALTSRNRKRTGPPFATAEPEAGDAAGFVPIQDRRRRQAEEVSELPRGE